MKKHHRWSKEEEGVLFRAVAEQPNNLHKAFIATSLETGRSIAGVRQHWYGVLCKNPDKANIAFMTISSKKAVINGKQKELITVPKNWFRKFISFFISKK